MSERRLRDVTCRPEHDPDEIKAFMVVVYRALKMITAYIERRYML